MGSRHRFLTLPLSVSGFPLAWVRASPFSSRLASFQAESRSLSYGLIVHLLLLPTPPLGDAVAVGYRPERAYLKRTSTSLTKCAFRRTIPAFAGMTPAQRSLRRILLGIPDEPKYDDDSRNESKILVGACITGYCSG